MKKKYCIVFLIVIVCNLLSPSLMKAQEIQPFQNGDRIAFVGNSITDGGYYHSYIWLYYMTHFPDRRIDIYNCGIGGDTSEDMYRRLDRDVLSRNPNVLTLSFGMNDTGFSNYGSDSTSLILEERKVRSLFYFFKIADKLSKIPNLRPIMIGSSPYDETTKFNGFSLPGKNAAIRDIISAQRKETKIHKWDFIDFNEPLSNLALAFQKQDPNFSICDVDRIHPDNYGHMFMAALFLQAQGFAGRPVSRIVLNGRKVNLILADNCRVSDIKRNKQGISFEYQAYSLPYPLDTVPHNGKFCHPQSEIRKLMPDFDRKFNLESLEVSRLKGQYELWIDSVKLGVFSADSLEHGVNMALLTQSPQYQQAQTIMLMNEQRWNVERKFRDYEWLRYHFFLHHGITDIDSDEAQEVFNRYKNEDFWVKTKSDLYAEMRHEYIRNFYALEIKHIIERIYKINKPKIHCIRLVKNNELEKIKNND